MVATSFARALVLTLKFEGGYSDNPRDPGGATNLGITQAALEYFRNHPVSKADVKALSLEEAAKIYKKNYWNAVCCDQMPAGIDMCLFDLCVNSGAVKAIKILQAAAGLKVNGILTAQTLAAAQQNPPRELIKSICYLRLSFLQRLTIFATFGRGWSARVALIESESAKLLAPRKCPVSPSWARSTTYPASVRAVNICLFRSFSSSTRSKRMYDNPVDMGRTIYKLRCALVNNLTAIGINKKLYNFSILFDDRYFIHEPIRHLT